MCCARPQGFTPPCRCQPRTTHHPENARGRIRLARRARAAALALAGEGCERILSVAREWRSVGEEQRIELELEQATVGGAQPALYTLRIVADVPVRNEYQRSLVVSDRAVGERERPRAHDVERALVRADGSHLVGDDAGCGLFAEREALDLLALAELVQPGLVAEDRAAEALHEAIAVAV